MHRSRTSFFRSAFLGVAMIALAASELAGGERAAAADPAGTLQEGLGARLVERYPGARIELSDFAFPAGLNGLVPSLAREVRITSESGQGTVTFVADGVEGSARFHAWVPAWIPIRRIAPLQKISRDQFARREVDVAAGRLRELRGSFLPSDAELDRLESRQTLLEGEVVLSTAVSPTPDVRRGDPVRVRLISGEILLSTQATAVENGYLQKSIRVLTERTKRELVGRLIEGRTVEVTL